MADSFAYMKFRGGIETCEWNAVLLVINKLVKAAWSSATGRAGNFNGMIEDTKQQNLS